MNIAYTFPIFEERPGFMMMMLMICFSVPRLDNALANAPPPFAVDAEACKRQLETATAVDTDNGIDNGIDHGVDNGVDNSDSDSEDLGPETAVDADDVDVDRIHVAAPTPPAIAEIGKATFFLTPYISV